MDLVNDRDRASFVAEEDRISNLPDDIIHHIFSFLDMKYVVRTSALSRRWEHIWTSITCLNLNARIFKTRPIFAKFVKHALSHRNNSIEVSAVKLTFSGSTNQAFVKDIISFSYSYNVRKLTLIWSTRIYNELPQCIFSSPTLEHLTLDNQAHVTGQRNCISNSAWDLPALETLILTNLDIGYSVYKTLDIFSECVKLKDITLHSCRVYATDMFNICSPQLLNLTTTDSDIWSQVLNVNAPQLKNLTVSCQITFPKVFRLIAPQLENLTARVSPILIGSPYTKYLSLSTFGFNSLEKVNLSLRSIFNEMIEVSQLLDLFKILRSAKSLILDMNIIEILSSSLDQLSHEPCPFNNLKFLKINTVPLKQKDPIPTVSTQVKNYLLENSPRATFIMDLPQKRSRQQLPNEKGRKKVAKVEK